MSNDKPKLESSDENKALLFLYTLSGTPFPEQWGATAQERQENVLAFLCFDGDADRAKQALVNNAILGYAKSPPNE